MKSWSKVKLELASMESNKDDGMRSVQDEMKTPKTGKKGKLRLPKITTNTRNAKREETADEDATITDGREEIPEEPHNITQPTKKRTIYVSEDGEYLPFELADKLFGKNESLQKDEIEINLTKVNNHMKPLSYQSYIDKANESKDPECKSIYKQLALQAVFINRKMSSSDLNSSTSEKKKTAPLRYMYNYTGTKHVRIKTPVLGIFVNIYDTLTDDYWKTYSNQDYDNVSRAVVNRVLTTVSLFDDFYYIFTGPVKRSGKYSPFDDAYLLTMAEVIKEGSPCRFDSQEEEVQHNSNLLDVIASTTSVHFYNRRKEAVDANPDFQREINEMLEYVKTNFSKPSRKSSKSSTRNDSFENSNKNSLKMDKTGKQQTSQRKRAIFEDSSDDEEESPKSSKSSTRNDSFEISKKNGLKIDNTGKQQTPQRKRVIFEDSTDNEEEKENDAHREEKKERKKKKQVQEEEELFE
ncbi:unnamed protein product [Caenorhabditis angaria]|uniref:Uncharacterized protein n=1 Tax=Caenorhabditis angaria TaxID=860376 RepID=A0A9P1N6V8_9PELO|nr:unnamed protein product [Caenorhabditis angaria]